MSNEYPPPNYGGPQDPNSGGQPNYGGAPQPNYGGPGNFGGPGREHPRGTLILILGILSIVCCGIFTAIPAVIMGKKALDESRAAHYSNEGIIKAGFICGLIGLVLSILGVIAWVVLIAAGSMA